MTAIGATSSDLNQCQYRSGSDRVDTLLLAAVSQYDPVATAPRTDTGDHSNSTRQMTNWKMDRISYRTAALLLLQFG